MLTIVKKRRVRTLFISDVHLGSPHSQVDRLLAFLEQVDWDTLVLVGDIFDGPGALLSARAVQLLTLVRARVSNGAEVIFVPGNHDAVFRDLQGEYDGLTIIDYFIHETASGQYILVTHGDQWDWLPSGSLLHRIDRNLPIPFWEFLRRNLKWFISRHIRNFERKAVREIGACDLVLCGHVHAPALNGQYANSGDWITHCSAIVEHHDGKLELVYA